MKPHAHLLRAWRIRVSQFWPWVLTVAVLGLTAELQWLQHPALQQANAAQSARMALLKQELAVALPLSSPDDLPASVKWPPFERIDTLTGDLHAMAQRAGVVVQEQSHALQSTDKRGHTGQIAVTVRLKGNYAAIKKTLAELLQAYESLALTGITLQKPRSDVPLLEAEVHFDFYWQDGHAS